jgi:hypothetical protein
VTVGTGLTTLGGALTVDGISTFNNNISQTGASTFSTGTGNVSLNGNTTITGTNTFSTGTGLVSLNGDTTLGANLDLLISAGTGTVDFRNTSGITIGEDTAVNTAGVITLIGAGANNFSTQFTTGTQTQNVNYILPPDDGDVNYVLTSDGTGILSWQSVTGVGAGTIIAVGNVTSGSSFTGSDSSLNKGNILTFEGSTSVDDANDIALTAVNPASVQFWPVLAS